MTNCTHSRAQRFGKTKGGEQRYRCCDCRKTFVASTGKLDGMRIGTDKAEQIIHCLVEGVGVRGTARLAGVANNTVLDLLVLIGQRCKLFLDDAVVGVPVKDVQADGDRYCFVGFERHNKLALAWHLGHRDHYDGEQFVAKLARACGNHDFQISTDGWRPYKQLVPSFMRTADFATLIKVYAPGHDTTRYSPGQIIEHRELIDRRSGCFLLWSRCRKARRADFHRR